MKTLVVVFVLVFSLTLVVGCLGSKEGELEKEMKSDDPRVRMEAAKKLGELATQESLRILNLSTGDPDMGVREEVRKSLEIIKKRTFFR